MLSEEEAVMLALRRNPTLDVARRERNVALIEAERARPAFRPQVSATGSQILRTPRVDLPGRPDDVVLPNSISRLEVGVRQPLYQFGVGSAPTQRANAMASAARTDFRKAELDTVLQTREAFLSLQRARALNGVAGRGVELAQENLRLTRLLLERGFQAEVDVLEAERALAEAESGKLRADNGVALARANLNRVMGRAIDAPFAAGDAPGLPPDPGPLSGLLPQALARRPEVQSLRHNIQAAEAGIKLARSTGQPRVDLEADYALQTKTALLPQSGFAAGVSVTIPLWDGGARRRTVREAEERLGQLQSALAGLEGGISLEVEQQRLAMGEARARLAVAERTVASAQKVHEITVLKLERGQAVQAEVLRTRLALESALGSRAEAENDLRLARARLDRALGEGPAADPGSGGREPDAKPSPGGPPAAPPSSGALEPATPAPARTETDRRVSGAE
jgi:outer membrane protein TolC